MGNSRLEQHPILTIAPRDDVPFTWDGHACTAKAGEVISSAVMAHGVRVFGHHPKDGSPQGLFCANGQCAQCLVLADATPADASGDGAARGPLPVKACMTPVTAGMRVAPLTGLPQVPAVEGTPAPREVERREVPVLIIGGGPAGLSAATELGRKGVPVLLIDDKDRLGGKLVLQTHRFFGSINAVYAGTRGIDIGHRLAAEATSFDTTEVWPSSTALAVFSDGWVGVLRGGDRYVLVKPRVLLVAAGSREKSLAFRGNTLPGVLGAGAFQTLLNRDQVRMADRLFVVGGGNVGLITAYHALQAGLEVVGLAEAAPSCGGYAVHRDKLARLGVPIHTSHTVLSANGEGAVASVTIARVDPAFRPIAGTERSFACDAVLVAVGLDPVDEFTRKARDAGMTVFAAGDCDEIAEASAAIFAGKIRGLEIARELGADVDEVPPDWLRTAEVLRSKPGPVGAERRPPDAQGVHPVFHCAQEIPCNPCTSVCPQGLIHIDESDIRQVPAYLGNAVAEACLGCEKCVRICPGLAITLVDHRGDPDHPTVTIPLEFGADAVHAGGAVTVLDTGGGVLGNVEVLRVKGARGGGGTMLVKVRAPAEIGMRIAGVRLQEPRVGEPLARYVARFEDDDVVCRCERVTAGELRSLIRAGHRDVNEIKAIVRAGMGACGAKTCAPLIDRLFRDEGVAPAEVTPAVRRPLFVEVPLGVFAGLEGG
jgi:sarcosine oxidase, subunit alpha